MQLMEACGLTPEELLQEVKQYITQENLNYSTMPFTQIDKDATYQFLSITQIEAKRVLQDLLVLIEKYRDNSNRTK